MTFNEEQTDELEALSSIYEDDNCFKKSEKDNQICYQYKFAAANENHSFIIDITCPEEYPNVIPIFSLDIFFNNHLHETVKKEIIKKISEFSQEIIGDAMIFSIIDWIKDNHENLLEKQSIVFQEEVVDIPGEKIEVDNSQTNKKIKEPKKERLTKNQKRKLANRVNTDGERPRGWNWVDPIKHLSKTGFVSFDKD